MPCRSAASPTAWVDGVHFSVRLEDARLCTPWKVLWTSRPTEMLCFPMICSLGLSPCANVCQRCVIHDAERAGAILLLASLADMLSNQHGFPGRGEKG